MLIERCSSMCTRMKSYFAVVLCLVCSVFELRGAPFVFERSDQELRPALAGVLGDIDRDGDLDAATTAGVLTNDGSGRFEMFQREFRYRGYTAPGLAFGDFNSDGSNDLWVAQVTVREAGIGDSVLINDGMGILERTRRPIGNASSVSVALGDVDRDGDLDAWVSTIFGEEDEVWLNDGAGVFQLSEQSFGPSDSTDVALGDLDGDGDLDAWVVNSLGASSLYLNSGDGLFTLAENRLRLASNFGGRSVALGDLDGDGDLDGLVASKGILESSGGIDVWMNTGSASFRRASRLGSATTHGLALGDLDRDGDLDVWLANEGPDEIWINDGLGGFSNLGLKLGDDVSLDVQLGDLDGDGDLDALVANRDESSGVWFNRSDAGIHSIESSERGLVIHFSGQLTRSNFPEGPYELVPNAESPLVIQELGGSEYFRAFR